MREDVLHALLNGLGSGINALSNPVETSPNGWVEEQTEEERRGDGEDNHF